MRVVGFAVLSLSVIGGCSGGGDGALGPEPPPEPVLPTVAELVPESIPYDSIGSQSIYFSRYLGGRYSGLVRLNGNSRSATVYIDPAFGTRVSASGQNIAYWWCCLGLTGDAIMLRGIGAADAAATRVSSSVVTFRSTPAWDPTGQSLYWVEGDGYTRLALVRKAVIPSQGLEQVLIEVPRPCGNPRGGGLAVAANGDVAFIAEQRREESGTGCDGLVLRWNAASNSIDTVAQAGALVRALAWSPEGSRLAVLRTGLQVTLHIVDASESKLIYEASLLGTSTVSGIEESVCWGIRDDRLFFSYLSGVFVSRVWAVRSDGSGAISITSPAARVGDVAADGNLSCTP